MYIKNLTLTYGIQTVFDDVSINIPANEKVGIVGVNGAGKTTLFKIIMKKLVPDSGKIQITNNKRVDWLPQVLNDEVPINDLSVLDYLIQARPIEKLEKELQDEYNKLSDLTIDQDKVFKNIDKINNKLAYWESEQAEGELLKISAGFNLDEMLDKKLSELSGGEKSKVAFARLLYSKPEIMLLDEPTNHLDKLSKDYIINYLRHYKGTVLIISHDIDFLNKIITKTLFIDKATKKFYLYDGNYDKFLKVKDLHIETLRREAKKQEKEEKKLREIVDKYKYSSGKMKRMAQDRE